MIVFIFLEIVSPRLKNGGLNRDNFLTPALWDIKETESHPSARLNAKLSGSFNVKARTEDFIIVPVYNEEERIASVLTEIKKFASTIIVVDDGSRDRTAEMARQKGVIVLQHKINLGKGAALKTGCDYALSKGAKKIVVIDGDGQHEPKEIPLFLQALDKTEIVFGFRRRPKTMPFILKFGNEFINNTLGLLYRIYLRDTQCGYRAFTAEAYQKVRWSALDYYMETEMIIRAGKNKLDYAELPIETIYADKYKGTTVLDGIIIVAKMLGGKLV